MKKVILTVLVVFGLFPLKASAPKGDLDSLIKYQNYQDQLKKTFITKIVMTDLEIAQNKALDSLFNSNTLLSNTTNKLAINSLANRLKLQPNWLSLIIYKENRGCTKTKNSLTNAVGIIQWLPSTAKALGTSVEELSKMSFTEQLEYVEKYLNYVQAVGKINSYEDLYLSIFFPKALGKDDSYIMGTAPPDSLNYSQMSFSQKVYAYNSAIDMNKDDLITVKDFKRFANTF